MPPQPARGELHGGGQSNEEGDRSCPGSRDWVDRRRVPSAVIPTPRRATISETTFAAWKPCKTACGEEPGPLAALLTAVTTASTSAPPNWNEVFTSPPARPCS